jgi:hypothetical protein
MRVLCSFVPVANDNLKLLSSLDIVYQAPSQYVMTVRRLVNDLGWHLVTWSLSEILPTCRFLALDIVRRV